MPVVVTATVLRWAVKGEPPKVVFENEAEVSLYTSGDGTEPPGAHDTEIMAEYILKHGALEELLIAAREGLLKVTDVKIRVIYPPPMPPERRGPQKQELPPKDFAPGLADAFVAPSQTDPMVRPAPPRAFR